MSSDAMEVVNRWRASNFERGAVEDVLAEDVEWVVPKGGDVAMLRGVDAVLEWYSGGGATDVGASEDPGSSGSLEVSEERGELKDFGDGRVGSVNRLIYAKESGEVAQVRSHRLVYTVRDGKIVRYELETLDESEVAGGSGRDGLYSGLAGPESSVASDERASERVEQRKCREQPAACRLRRSGVDRSSQG